MPAEAQGRKGAIPWIQTLMEVMAMCLGDTGWRMFSVGLLSTGLQRKATFVFVVPVIQKATKSKRSSKQYSLLPSESLAGINSDKNAPMYSGLRPVRLSV